MRTWIIALLMCAATVARANPDTPRDVEVGFQAGISDQGVVGIELRHGHFGLSVGAPGVVGLRVYSEAPGQRWYAGASVVRFEGEFDGEHRGREFSFASFEGALVSGGYRWQFQSGINLTAGLNAFIGTADYREAGTFRGTAVFPTLSAGFSF